MSEFNDTLERISMQLEQIEESLSRRPLICSAARQEESVFPLDLPCLVRCFCMYCKALRSPTCPLLANFWQNWCAL